MTNPKIAEDRAAADGDARTFLPCEACVMVMNTRPR